jgi:hypothetical protein
MFVLSQHRHCAIGHHGIDEHIVGKTHDMVVVDRSAVGQFDHLNSNFTHWSTRKQCAAAARPPRFAIVRP